jgi:uncharacterized protein
MARLRIAVVPRASAERVGPYLDGTLSVRVTRPPAGGEANRAVLRLVAAALGVPHGSVVLVGGQRGRRKWIEIDELSEEELARRLAGLAD